MKEFRRSVSCGFAHTRFALSTTYSTRMNLSSSTSCRLWAEIFRSRIPESCY